MNIVKSRLGEYITLLVIVNISSDDNDIGGSINICKRVINVMIKFIFVACCPNVETCSEERDIGGFISFSNEHM